MNLSVCDFDDLRQTLVNLLSQELRVPETQMHSTRPLTEYGIDSIVALTIAGELGNRFSIVLPATLLWDHPSIEQIAQYLYGAIHATA